MNDIHAPELVYKKFPYSNEFGQGSAWSYLLRGVSPDLFWGDKYWNDLAFELGGSYWNRQKSTTEFTYEIVSPHKNRINRYNIPQKFKKGIVNSDLKLIDTVQKSLSKYERLFNIKFTPGHNLTKATKKSKSARQIRIFFTTDGFKSEVKDAKTGLVIGESCGCAFLPGHQYGGDVFIRLYKDNTGKVNRKYNNKMEETVIHELGHALGLMHPMVETSETKVIKILKKQLPPDNPFNSQFFSIMAYGPEIRSGIGPLGYIALGYLYGFNPQMAQKFSTYNISYLQKKSTFKRFMMWREGQSTKKDRLYGKDQCFNWGAIIGPDAYILNGYTPSQKNKQEGSFFPVYLNAKPNSYSGFLGKKLNRKKVGDQYIESLESLPNLEKVMRYAWFNVSKKIKILVNGYGGGVLYGYKNTKFIVKKAVGKTHIFPGKEINTCVFEDNDLKAQIHLNKEKALNFQCHIFLKNLTRIDLETERKRYDLIIRSRKNKSNQLIISDYYRFDKKLREKQIRFITAENFSYNTQNFEISPIKDKYITSYAAAKQYIHEISSRLRIKPMGNYVPLVFATMDSHNVHIEQNSKNKRMLYIKDRENLKGRKSISINHYQKEFHKFGIFDKNGQVICGQDDQGVFHFSYNALPHDIIIPSHNKKIKIIKIKDLAMEFFTSIKTSNHETVLLHEGKPFLKIKGKSSFTILDCENRTVRTIDETLSQP